VTAVSKSSATLFTARGLPNKAFVAVHVVLLLAATAWGALRVHTLKVEHVLPPLRNEPLSIGPLYDYDVVISDEQLTRVLAKLPPHFEAEKTKINHVDHGLRFWTAAAKFDDPKFLSGGAMRRLLMDHRRFAEVYGNKQPPLLMPRRSGVAVRVQEGSATSSHVDHTLCCLAEVGTPLDFPLITPAGKTTYRAMVEGSLRDFSLNQTEYEWSAVTYAMFLPPVKRWYTTEGQEISFDRLADRIMREDLPDGVCFGNHRLYALVVMLRVDDQTPILSAEIRARIMEFLRDTTAMLVRNQHPDGFWNGDWPHAAPTSSQPTDRAGDRLPERILATGHALEWWAMAPSELHPPRPTLAAAGQWLVRTIDELTPEQTQQNYTYLSHAGRALALWRSRSPAEVELPKVASEAEALKVEKENETGVEGEVIDQGT
jgi:hypothetical protein